MNGPVISVVIPVFKSPETLSELASRIVQTLELLDIPFEIILVNDGSPDDSWEIILELASADERVVGLRLSRNFGQHAAITAGLHRSIGEWVVVMDCDLQDQPEEIPNLYRKALEGFEQVLAIRHNRRDSWIKRKTSLFYVKSLSFLSDLDINPSVGNFGIYHRRVINVITSLREQGRTFGLLALWSGFRRCEIEVEHVARPYGQSSYTIRSLVRLGLQGILSHSDKPLRLTIKLGALTAAGSMACGFWLIARHFVAGRSPIGWSSVMVSITFSTGVLLSSIGVTGLYIGRIFDEVKYRPTFIVWESTDSPK